MIVFRSFTSSFQRLPTVGCSILESTSNAWKCSQKVYKCQQLKNLSSVREFRRPRQPTNHVQPSNRSGRDFSVLLRPAMFTVSLSGASFAACSIWQYENLRTVAKSVYEKAHSAFKRKLSHDKAFSRRNELNEIWNRMSDGAKVATVIISLNSLVFLLWKVPSLARTMRTYFTASPMGSAASSSLLFSTFSHYSGIHLFCNMYVLWSFSPPIVSLLGKEQFVATYLSAGVFAGFCSHLFKVIRYSTVPSVGASGAIMALLGALCVSQPDARISVAFLDMIYPHSFTISSGVSAIVLLDACGVIFGWRKFDHAAHLGGMLFGLWYMQYGRHYIWGNREKLLKRWHELRGSIK